MKRVNVYRNSTNDYEGKTYCGWLDLDSAKILAKKEEGSPYIDYSWVYLTAGGKLVLNTSNNTSGSGEHYWPCTAEKALRLIIEAGTDDGQKWIEDKKNIELLKKYEI